MATIDELLLPSSYPSPFHSELKIKDDSVAVEFYSQQEQDGNYRSIVQHGTIYLHFQSCMAPSRRYEVTFGWN
uniref:Uncharacterized protein n=1 Tax=Oryza glumipatula TaxID=40148 RepID=A0A0D9Z7Y7_9ORYZ